MRPGGPPPPSATPSNSATPSRGASSPAADGPQQLLGGRLTWGVKEGFRSYVVKGGGSVTPAGFTAEGATAIGAPSAEYAEGKPTDPVTLSVSVDKDVVIPTTAPTTASTSTIGGAGGTGGTVGGGGGVGGNLATTGAEVPAAALLATSGAVVAAGAGAVFLARRRRAAQI
ncbi:hypothetical protein ACFY0N_37865 [Streptomyces vinaceus]|uniref:hypothetical protein n=1 Tax=Streptomyces vinaceus TaxID=1960 RepID=UPI0036C1D6D3